MSDLQTNCPLKLNFPKVDQHTGGKGLIHGSKHHKENQLRNLELRFRIEWYFLFINENVVCEMSTTLFKS